MFLKNSAFVGKIFLYLSKCTVKKQFKKATRRSAVREFAVLFGITLVKIKNVLTSAAC
jgi:hypothetical protein